MPPISISIESLAIDLANLAKKVSFVRNIHGCTVGVVPMGSWLEITLNITVTVS